MMRKTVCAAVILAAFSCQSFAGIVLEMVSKDLRSNREAPPDKIFAQSNMLRIEPHEEENGQKTSIIFRDNALLIVNHGNKSYHRMDEESLARMSSQMNDAMKQMEEQLAKLPPEQRAMMEKMMKGKMQGAMPEPMTPKPLPRRIEDEGSEQVEGYSCQKYGVYRGSEKIQEICAAPLSQVGDVEEVMDAFKGMAHFSEKMLESFTKGPFANMADDPFQTLNEIDGFPVLTRHFNGGEAVREVLFKSATRQDLSDDLFSPPSDYKEVDPFAQMGGRRR